jgi:hypothetical protein
MISRLTSLGFGVAVMYETVALGNSRLTFFSNVNSTPFATSGGSSRRSVQLFLANFGKEGVPETVVPKSSQTLAKMVGTFLPKDPHSS